MTGFFIIIALCVLGFIVDLLSLDDRKIPGRN
jgi:hypothetical protein